jgi:hypothetical protein
MRIIGLAAALSVATPVLANHPGDNLNQMIAAKEASFEAVAPRPAPVSEWTDNAGDVVGMEELKGKIVAVSFAPSDCGAPCVHQQAKLAETLAFLNASPMREMVQFVTLGDGQVATPAGFDNWTGGQSSEGNTIGDLAAAFAIRGNRGGEASMIHLFDRNGQLVGLFHGSDFVPLNLVFYINGLTNAHSHPEPGLFERLFGWLS